MSSVDILKISLYTHCLPIISKLLLASAILAERSVSSPAVAKCCAYQFCQTKTSRQVDW